MNEEMIWAAGTTSVHLTDLGHVPMFCLLHAAAAATIIYENQNFVPQEGVAFTPLHIRLINNGDSPGHI